MKDIRDNQHGTATGYSYGCRCADCRAAIAKANRERTPRAIRPEDHGTYNAYNNLKCRCTDCRAAWAVVQYEQRRARMGKATPLNLHGTPGGYGNYGCRCQPCTEAWGADCKARNKRNRATGAPPRIQKPPVSFDPHNTSDVRHGTITGYAYKCRCDRCRAASADYARERRLRKRLN